MNGHVPEKLRQRVREQAGNRCGYCLSPQHLVLGTLEIEHLVPRGRGGSDDEWNLWLACRLCNNHKSDQTSAPDPETGQEVSLSNVRGQGAVVCRQWLRRNRRADAGRSPELLSAAVGAVCASCGSGLRSGRPSSVFDPWSSVANWFSGQGSGGRSRAPVEGPYFAAGISSSSSVLAITSRSSQSSSWATSAVDSTVRTTPRGTSPNRLRSRRTSVCCRVRTAARSAFRRPRFVPSVRLFPSIRRPSIFPFQSAPHEVLRSARIAQVLPATWHARSRSDHGKPSSRYRTADRATLALCGRHGL